MRIHTYVVQHDKGFAPNPFFGVCTLACCKPRTRARAELGDVVMGFGSNSRALRLGGRVIYWMRVDEILTFDAYWHDPRFLAKRPIQGSSLMSWYGDNIYHRSPINGDWMQAFSFHRDGEGLGRGNLQRDTGRTDRVLVSRDFAYWGRSAPTFPTELLGLVPKNRSERNRYSEEEKADIMAWINSRPERGRLDEPVDWSRDHRGPLIRPPVNDDIVQQGKAAC